MNLKHTGNRMKKVLFISIHSFPVTGAEEIVNARLLSILTKNGEFHIDLLTKKKKYETYPSDSLEEYGIKLHSLSMVEVGNKINLTTIWQHFLTFLKFGFVRKGYHWSLKALPVAEKLVKENKYDYIITRTSPAALIGYYLKKKYGVKWVCTWNDPAPDGFYPKPYGKGNGAEMVKKNRNEISIMRQADHFIYPSPRLAAYMNSFLLADNNKISIVPHVMMQEPKEAKKLIDKPIKLIHSGNCTDTRKALNLLTALQELVTENKIGREEIQLSFLGKVNLSDEEKMKETPLNEMVEKLEPVTYLQSLELLKEYDVAVIIEADWDEGVFLPTKVSDFMMQGKRIFTISPINGLLHDMYEEGYISYFADVKDVSSIKAAIVQIVADSKKPEWNDYTVTIPENYRPEPVLRVYREL